MLTSYLPWTQHREGNSGTGSEIIYESMKGITNYPVGLNVLEASTQIHMLQIPSEGIQGQILVPWPGVGVEAQPTLRYPPQTYLPFLRVD